MAQLSYTQPVRAKKLTATSHQAVTGPAVFYGLDVNDDASGNVHVHVYNGTSNTGVMVSSAVPANGDHDQHWFGPNGILCPSGIYVEVVSGTPSGSIFYR
jgi:hypothetical protein